jgi:hypothetical protein
MNCCLPEKNCHENYGKFDYAEVGISDFFSHYPLKYRDRTYIDSIDQVFQGRKYPRSKPNHDYLFESCSGAIAQANKDFIANKPSLIQFNGIGGKFPYINDVYDEVIGLYIFNTGCYLYQFVDCYNDKMLELLNDRYQRDLAVFLDVIDSLERRIVIDVDQNIAVLVDGMPTIKNLNFDGKSSLNNTGMFCRYEYFLIGRFVLEVRKDGQARVLEYVEGSLDCECVEKMKMYFENSAWKPAVINGVAINSIVQVQFIN